jgi:hypothetical protein
LTVFDDFEQQQPRHPHGIAGRVQNLFALIDSLGDPVDRFVSVVFGKGTAAPFEEARQIGSDFEVFFAATLAISTESDEQLIEGFRG